VFICIQGKNNPEYLNVWTYPNFASFSKLENFSPLNPEILVKNMFSQPIGCREISFCLVGHFILSQYGIPVSLQLDLCSTFFQ